MKLSDNVTPNLKELFIETAKVLKGHQKRLFMARTVTSLGHGGLKFAREELGWDKNTIWKGQNELRTGIECLEAVALRGRKSAEEHLPNLLADIEEIVDGQSQTDATFATEQLYTRLSAEEVRRQLIKQKEYEDNELPTAKTIGVKLNQMGYHLKAVVKSKPQKKLKKQMPFLSD
jgi:hypothetical protein